MPGSRTRRSACSACAAPTSSTTRTPRLDGYQQLLQAVADHPDVTAWSPQASDAASVNLAGEDGASLGESFTQLWGVEPARYREAFPEAAELIAGSFLEPDQVGLVLSEEVATDLGESAEREIRPGDRLLLTATTDAGIKVREVPVTGIFRFRNALPQLNFVSFVDITTLRTLTGMTVSAPAEQIPDRGAGRAARLRGRGRPVWRQ